MQGVGEPVVGDRAPRGDQRLRRDLSAEDAGDDGGPGLAAEDVLLDLLKVEQIEQGLQVPDSWSQFYRPVISGTLQAHVLVSFAMIDFMISLVPP